MELETCIANVGLGYDLKFHGNPSNGSRDRMRKYFSLRECHMPNMNLLENTSVDDG